MKTKWTNQALDLHRERLARQEAKAEAGRRRKKRGLTIRDAFAALNRINEVNTENVDENDDGDDDYGYDADGVYDDDEGDDQQGTDTAGKAKGPGANDGGGGGNENDDEDDEFLPTADAAAGSFSMEQCIAHVREKARKREEDANRKKGFISDTTDESSSLSKEELEKRRLREQLENRQLQNELNSKRENSKYKEILSTRTQLPAFQMRSQIVDAISRNRVVVVSGDTGCGMYHYLLLLIAAILA